MLARPLPSAACWQPPRIGEPPSLPSLGGKEELRTDGERETEPRRGGPSSGLRPGAGLGVAVAPESPPRPSAPEPLALSYLRPCAGCRWGDASLGISGQQPPSLAEGFYKQKRPGPLGNLAAGSSAGPDEVFQVVLLLKNLPPSTSRASLPHACPKPFTGPVLLPTPP